MTGEMGGAPPTFDEVYGTADRYFGGPSPGLLSLIQKYGVLPGRALDVGAGEGRNSLHLTRIGFSVVAVDKSAEGIRKLREAAEAEHLEVETVVGEFLDADLPRLFDLIVAVTSLEHMTRPEIARAAAKIEALLAEGGFLYVVALTVDDPGFEGAGEHVSELSKHVRHYFGRGELRGLFKSLRIREYAEYKEWDHSHGRPHIHGVARLVAQKGAEQ